MVPADLDIYRDNGQLEALRDDFNKMLGKWQDGKFWVQSFRELKHMVPHLRGQRLVSYLNIFFLLSTFASYQGDLTNERLQVVPAFSSAINNEWESRDDIDENQIDMCRFGSKEDVNYQVTFNVVTRFRKDTLDMIAMPRPKVVTRVCNIGSSK